MFFQGDLQSGIAQALQEQKLVACFVHDDGATSRQWEDSWLPDEEVRSLLEANVVLLQLKDGSQEAGFLAAFCEIPSVPSLLMISNGQLTAKLTADLTQKEFKSGLVEVLGGVQAGSPNVPSSHEDDQAISNAELPPTGPERKETTASKGKAPVRASETRTAEPQSSKAARQQANQVKKAKQEARDERQRILQKIENDKQERRAREQHRRSDSKPESDPSTIAPSMSPRSEHPSSPSSSIRECAIQVRLFDGSTIRQRFSSWKTVRTHVRPWIDKQREDDSPYTFRHILAPKPNRQIGISEEDEDLETLGLYPSATLVMVPVQGYTTAYTQQTNPVSQGVSTGYNIVSSGVGMLGSAIGSLFGYGSPSQENVTPAAASASSSQPVRSIERDEPDDESHHLYTGNGINVEPPNELKREDSWG